MSEPALQPLSRLSLQHSRSKPKWTMSEVSGRLVELSEPYPTAALSFTFLLVREAQASGHHATWIGSSDSTFYPPDAAANGVDLRSLPVLRMDNPHHLGRSAEILLRCGVFRLLILDIGRRPVTVARLSQLHGLARVHNSCVLFLTEKQPSDQSLSSLVSLRAQTSRRKVSDNVFTYELHVLRDKKRGLMWTWNTQFSGIDGYF